MCVFVCCLLFFFPHSLPLFSLYFFVSVLGLDGAPQAGDNFNVLEDEREAKQIAAKRTQLLREQNVRTQRHITLDEIGRRIALGDFKELNMILKGDVDGSVEALTDSLQKLSTEEIQVNIVIIQLLLVSTIFCTLIKSIRTVQLPLPYYIGTPPLLLPYIFYYYY